MADLQQWIKINFKSDFGFGILTLVGRIIGQQRVIVSVDLA